MNERIASEGRVLVVVEVDGTRPIVELSKAMHAAGAQIVNVLPGAPAPAPKRPSLDDNVIPFGSAAGDHRADR